MHINYVTIKSTMKIPIVDQEDNIIGYKEREETTREDIRRIVTLNIFNEKDEVLIAKRHATKKLDPNMWGPAVEGTVDEGYDYDATVVKEAEEEVGLKNIRPVFYRKLFYENAIARRFVSFYSVRIDSSEKLSLQEDEVAEIKWVNLPDLEKWAKEKPGDFLLSFPLKLEIIKEMYETQS